MSLVPFLALFVTLSVSAFADSISDRITVTVCGHGPDVVLIPGMSCSRAVWDRTFVHLEGRYRLHLVQLDGFAGMPSCANAHGPVTQPVLDALDAYIKANQLKSPAIIGHSYGGSLGMMLAIQHPEDVGRLMIVDSLPFGGLLFGAQATFSQPRQKLSNYLTTLSRNRRAPMREAKKGSFASSSNRPKAVRWRRIGRLRLINQLWPAPRTRS